MNSKAKSQATSKRTSKAKSKATSKGTSKTRSQATSLATSKRTSKAKSKATLLETSQATPLAPSKAISEAPLIYFRRNVQWTNKHQNIQVSVERLYDVWNRWKGGRRPGTQVWQAGLAALRRIVTDAERLGKRIRGLGAGWSLSEAPVTSEYLVNVKPLNYIEVGLRPESVDPAFAGTPGRLVFAQCGASILELNQQLEARGLCLPTSGASNGQTLYGAVSTGTHGSASRVGSLQDHVVGMHVVAEGGQGFWIERASRPVVGPAFLAALGARLLRDDRLFNAASVGFGSFGLGHAMLVEAVPIFLLERHVRRYDYDDVRAAIRTLDVSRLGLPGGGALPFHFEVVVNPYATARGRRGAYVRFMYQRPFRPITTSPGPVVTTGAGDDLLGVMSALSDVTPSVIPIAVEELLDRMVPATTGVLGTPGQTFGTTDIRGPVLSTELGVALQQVEAAVDAIVEVARRNPFGGVIALRYVKASDALLAHAPFATTCTIELPAVGSKRTAEGLRRVWAALDRANIPYALHWGQVHNYTIHRLRAVFGARLDDWLAARRQFLPSAAGRRMFSNAMLDQVGLSG